jgi:hypothetical protein
VFFAKSAESFENKWDKFLARAKNNKKAQMRWPVESERGTSGKPGSWGAHSDQVGTFSAEPIKKRPLAGSYTRCQLLVVCIAKR